LGAAFLADALFVCDTLVPVSANADAQNAREIATLAHPIDQLRNPLGRILFVIPLMCAL
jgi:hypothetical protein